MNEVKLRESVVQAVQRLDARGLNRGSTGNASMRMGGGMLITPTGMGVEVTSVDLPYVAWGGTTRGRWKPSSEWPFHEAIYRARPDVHAVVHTHSPHATALACLRRPLPAFHYMVAVAGGDSVPLVPYFTFGTEVLSAAVAKALLHRDACLLANHGLVVAGPNMAQALKVVEEVESLCGMYLQALAAGEPVLLTAEQMAEVLEKFRSYGKAAAA